MSGAVTAASAAPGLRRRIRRWSRRPRRWAAKLVHAWRRSLQLRVGLTSAVVTAVLVVVVGLFLVDQIVSGVLKAKRSAAVAQANAALDPARSEFSNVAPGDLTGIGQAVDKLGTDLAASGTDAGLYVIAVRSPDRTVDAQIDSPAVAIPEDLRRQVQQGNQATRYAVVQITAQGHPAATLIVGEPLVTDAGSFELYYLFPLGAEQDTVDLVQRTVLLAGVALVLLVALIAVFLTRQVVRPVRVAAMSAEQLAAGDLSQRLPVRGEDDIAKLAESFNDMASSLQQQIKRLEQLSRVQQRFTSDVSHELRTPLTTIRMASELLYTDRALLPPELSRSVELLNRELDRFENLLADLLEISRYDAGAAALEAERVDLVGIVERSVLASEVLAQRHGVDITVRAPAHPVVAEVDARRVERILRNLLANALDHAEGSAVQVTLGESEDTVAVTVRDHGVGLRPGEAALVFNRFWRADPSRSRLTGGTGLGLAISLEDARLHHGWLQAWGERGNGAVFRLTLPRTAGGTVVASPLALDPSEVTT